MIQQGAIPSVFDPVLGHLFLERGERYSPMSKLLDRTNGFLMESPY